jgi:hypothetical protein
MAPHWEGGHVEAPNTPHDTPPHPLMWHQSIARCAIATWWADWLAIAVAIALPWSTTGSLVLILLWWLARFGMGDHAAVFHEVRTLAGGLPPALARSAPSGYCGRPYRGRNAPKASVDSTSCSPFRRCWLSFGGLSGNPSAVGIAASCTVLLVASWVWLCFRSDLARTRGFTGHPGPRPHRTGSGIHACAFGFCEAALRSWCRRRLWLAFALLLLSLLFSPISFM